MPKYNWVAVYPDSRDSKREVGFPMVRPDGTRNRYEDIDRANLTRFEIHDSSLPTNPTVLALYFSKGQELIWRMRVEKCTTKKDYESRVHIVGWQKRVEGRSIVFVFALSEATGKIVASDGWRKDDPWLFDVDHDPIRHPGETPQEG